MSEEEIKKQYANGIVNADEVIKSLIDKFKIDKTSVDIQQLQLIVEYLLYKVDKLQKEIEDYKNLCLKFSEERDKIIKEEMELQKENERLQKDNYKLDRENQHYFDRIQDLQKENAELKEEIKKQYKQYIKDHTEVIENLKKDSISKNEIREIVEKSYNDIDYFKRDIIKDLELLGGE